MCVIGLLQPTVGRITSMGHGVGINPQGITSHEALFVRIYVDYVCEEYISNILFI